MNETYKRKNADQEQQQQQQQLMIIANLVHEINHMVASYKNMVQSVGTHSDSVHLREDLQHLKEQCLRTCDSAKNCILPQLKRLIVLIKRKVGKSNPNDQNMYS
ncbi:conserved hypothetical protein [Trichinella spiralis]|nr:conserved hypothetical protein [Trichinella spiralis]